MLIKTSQFSTTYGNDESLYATPCIIIDFNTEIINQCRKILDTNPFLFYVAIEHDFMPADLNGEAVVNDEICFEAIQIHVRNDHVVVYVYTSDDEFYCTFEFKELW